MLLPLKKILFGFQQGLRKKYSTKTCLGHFTDTITTGFEKYCFTEMILIDLQEAFDINDHQILLKKEKIQDFLKNTITWFTSYLYEQKSKISIKTNYSSSSNLLCSVPQECILGPVLFLLCINDLPQTASGNWLCHAEDTCIVFLYKSVIESEKQLLIRYFSSLCDLFVNNKFGINFGQDKTKSILFGNKHKLRNTKSLNIICNDKLGNVQK